MMLTALYEKDDGWHAVIRESEHVYQHYELRKVKGALVTSRAEAEQIVQGILDKHSERMAALMEAL